VVEEATSETGSNYAECARKMSSALLKPTLVLFTITTDSDQSAPVVGTQRAVNRENSSATEPPTLSRLGA